MSENNPACEIIVTGSHRSGTSAITTFLANLGIDVGSPDMLLDAAKDNENGFFERLDVMAINDDMLTQAHSTWDYPDIRALQLLESKELDLRIAENVIEVLASFRKNERTFLLKDPRFCLTLPFWLNSLRRPLVIICLRNPLEIARSLQKREGFSIYKSLAVWESYILNLSQITPLVDCIYVDFNQLLNDPKKFARQLRDELVQHGVQGLSNADEAINTSFRTGLKHEEANEQELEMYLSSRQIKLWAKLVENKNVEGVNKEFRSTFNREAFLQKNTGIGYAKLIIQLFQGGRERSHDYPVITYLIKDKQKFVFPVNCMGDQIFRLEPLNKSCVVSYLKICAFSGDQFEVIEPVEHNGIYDLDVERYYFPNDEPSFVLKSTFNTVTKIEIEIVFSSLDDDEIKKIIIDYFVDQHIQRSRNSLNAQKSDSDGLRGRFLSNMASLSCVAKLLFDPVNVSSLVKNFKEIVAQDALFSAEFYKANNPDIASRKINPLLHFLVYGWKEGRNPSPNFDVTFYLQSYPDVKAKGVNPLLHYIDKGWREGRNPSSSFNTRKYIAVNPDVLQAGVSPLVHASDNSIKDGQENEKGVYQFSTELKKVNLVKEILVIIPVYLCRDEGVDSFSLLLSSLLQSYPEPKSNLSFLFIDDASPLDLCESLLEKGFVREREDVLYLQNKKNKGFVGTINRGFENVPEASDVVILNSDTEIHGSVFEILQRACYRRPKIATVTPLSNRATIACLTNWPLGGVSVLSCSPKEIALAVEEIGLISPDSNVPTGHGFCMYIASQALGDVGLFDEETFGDGYGEENDWCMRAMQLGYTHIICTECYVHHHESRSFDSTQKQQLQKKNSEKLEEKYPYYLDIIREYMHKNPLSGYRKLLQLLLLNILKEKHGKETICFVIHDSFTNCTGGVQQHVKQLTAELNREKQYEVIIIAPEKLEGKLYEVHLVQEFDTIEVKGIPGDGLGDLLSVLEKRIDYLHVHHTFGLDEVLLTWIRNVSVLKKVLSIHDYDLFCSNPFMLNDRGESCSPYEEDCCTNRTCLSKKTDVKRELLLEFDTIIVPSENCLRYVEMHNEDLDLRGKIQILPHCLAFADYVTGDRQQEEILADSSSNVVFLGSLFPHKGGELFLQSCSDLRERGFNTLVFGHAQSALLETFKDIPPIVSYRNWKELQTLKGVYGVQVVVMPAICAETFSYTLYEALFLLGVPVVVGAYGNPKEVVEKHRVGEVIEDYSVGAVVAAVEKIVTNYDTYLDAIHDYRTAAMQDFTAASYVGKYLEIFSKDSQIGHDNHFGESFLKLENLSFESHQIMNNSLLEKPSHQMRVLVVHALTEHDPPFFFRVKNPVNYLRKGGCEVVVLHLSEIPVDSEGYDLIYLSRTPKSSELLSLLKSAKVNGIPTILDVDDLIFRSEFIEKFYFVSQDSDKFQEYQALLHSMESVFEEVDVLLASTPEIASFGEKYGKTSLVFRNRLRFTHLEIYREMYSAKPLYKEKIIGYFSGSNTHDEDFSVLVPALERLLKRDPEVRLLIMGFLGKNIISDEYSSQLIFQDFSNYECYLEAMQRCKVIVAPIAQINSFSHSKSNIKLLESAAVGTPLIASPISEMAYAIDHGVNGWIATDSDDWFTMIQNVLLSDHTDYVVRNMNSYVMENFSDGSLEFCNLLASVAELKNSGFNALNKNIN